MKIISTDYHDYVFKDHQLVGEFDQMYTSVFLLRCTICRCTARERMSHLKTTQWPMPFLIESSACLSLRHWERPGLEKQPKPFSIWQNTAGGSRK